MHSERLVLLVMVAVVAAGYVARHHRRPQIIARYTDPALLSKVAPGQLGWRRHVPGAVALAGLTLIILAVAQPTRAEQIPRNEGVVVVAIDVSESMVATDVAPSRIQAAIAGALSFARSVPSGIQLGLVACDGGARLVVSPTTDRTAIMAAIQRLRPGPGTAGGEAIYTALDAIHAALSTPSSTASAGAASRLPAAIVLMSDGVTNQGRPILRAAGAAHDAAVPVSTIAFGTPNGVVHFQGQDIPVPADPDTMAAVARLSGGRTFSASSLSQLESVYRNIVLKVGYTTQQREVTTAVLGVALAVVVMSTVLAMAWTSRPL